mmetsp:Transcript_21899/g.41796  ORF Transcript_21899/g.41796 Transcript_21899/m.41796 type:complete len:118 (+) Transcript_21899:186-539(+)
MGRTVLLSNFVEPIWQLLETLQACAAGGEGCKVPQFNGLTDGSAVLHATMFMLACTTNVLFMSGTLLLLIFHKDYRAGVRDEDLWQQVRRKHHEIIAWGKQRKEMHDQGAMSIMGEE